MAVKRVAFLVFPRLTVLDFIGAYDALRRIASMGIEAEVVDDSGLVLKADSVYEDLREFDLLYVPGGVGTRALLDDARLIAYLRSWPRPKPLASVCTGALLLGRAGHLADRRATT